MLAPDVPSAKAHIQNCVTASQAVTQYSQAVATLIPAYYPALAGQPPSLKAQLAGVVAHAATWPNALCGRVSQTIPQQFITESTQFTSLASTILWTQQQLAINDKDAQALALLEKCLQSLLGTAGVDAKTLQTLQQQLVAYENTLQSDHMAIAETLAQLASIVPNGVAIVESLSATLSVSFVQGQQIGPCIAIVQVESSVEVQLREAMGVAPQIVPVALMRALLDQLLARNESATQAMSRLLDTWSTFAAKLAAVIDDLQQADAQQLAVILQQLDVQQAMSAWNQLAAFAQTING